jgi:hypothetical protein
MKIYKDRDMTFEVDTLDFGVVPAGDTERKTYWIYNDSNAYYQELEFIVEHIEVEVVDAPKELSAQAVAELIVEWSPSVTLKEGLRTRLRIKGKELWG